MFRTTLVAAFTLLATTALASPADAQDASMNFFLTSNNPGDGANLGGLEGADAWCEHLAYAVGQDDKTWRAYLSQQAMGGQSSINARDRIGDGPWYNYEGVMVAEDVDQLHGDNNLTKETALSEQGTIIHGREDDPNRHDILTGATLDGVLADGDEDTTCSNWSTNGEGSALVGHFDRTGGGANPESWVSAHGTQGCGQDALRGTGGDGLFYCFATDE